MSSPNNPQQINGTSVQARRTVAIIGAGPAGSALAIRLRQRDIPVVVFDSDKRPPLLVGESLIPAVVPHLHALGVADHVAAFSVRKPGAALIHRQGARAEFEFQDFGAKAPDHAWNVPRPQFDESLAERARQLGAWFVSGRAHLERNHAEHNDAEITLDDASMQRAGMAAQPGLLVDATGRARAVSRALKIKAERGGRDDVACFAHYSAVNDPDIADGRIAISILENGWSWRIPLPGKVSVGIVVPRAALADAGGKAEQVLDARIQREPLLHRALHGADRVTPAMRYEHYQLVGERASGPGWVAVGDAFGFVDPMLSPGVFMALESAAELAQRIELSPQHKVPQLRDARGYETCLRDWFACWTEVIESFYDGRMLALQREASKRAATAGRLSLHPIIEGFARRRIAQLVSGANTRSRLSRAVLAHSANHLLQDVEAEDQAIRFAVQGSTRHSTRINWTAGVTRPVPSS